MVEWRRRTRGAVGVGMSWAAVWCGAGLIFMVTVAPDADVPFPLFWGLLGFIAGVTFAGLLGIIEHKRTFEQLSLPRFAGWGGLGGFLLSLILVPAAGLYGEFLLLGPLFALAGAGCAAGMLALARKGNEQHGSVTSSRPGR